MEYISLDYAKKHLNIEPDFTDDDEYVMGLIQVAQDAVEEYICRPLEEVVDENGCELPAPLCQAMLILIGELYQKREATTAKQAVQYPFGFYFLANLYKRWP